jgi:hypothetical protein
MKEMKCKSNPDGPTQSLITIMIELFILFKQKSFRVVMTDKTSAFDRKIYYKKRKHAQDIVNTTVTMYMMSLPFTYMVSFPSLTFTGAILFLTGHYSYMEQCYDHMAQKGSPFATASYNFYGPKLVPVGFWLCSWPYQYNDHYCGTVVSIFMHYFNV